MSQWYITPSPQYERAKKYLPINIRRQIRTASVKEAHVPAIVSEEEWRNIEKEAESYSLASTLAEMRAQSGITQKEMAQALSVSQPRISEIESTPNAKVSLGNIRKYVELTRRSFKARLEDGTTITLSLPRKPRAAKAATAP